MSHPALLNITYLDTSVVVEGSMMVKNKMLYQKDLNRKFTLAKAYPTNRLIIRLHATQERTRIKVLIKNLSKV